MITRDGALDVLLDRGLTPVERATALREAIIASHVVEASGADYLYYLGRKFWNRRDAGGKFTDGPRGRKVVTPAPTRGPNTPATKKVTLSGKGSKTAPSPGYSVPTTSEDEIKRLERLAFETSDDERRSELIDSLLDLQLGKESAEGDEAKKALRSLRKKRYEMRAARERRSAADRDKAERLAAQRTVTPTEDEKPAPVDLEARNAAIDEEIADIERRKDEVSGYIEKNVAKIAALDLDDEAQAAEAKRIGLVNARHERTLASHNKAIENLEMQRVDVESAGSSSQPREVDPDIADRRKQRGLNQDIARVIGPAPFTDDSGRTVIRDTPNATGAEEARARQALNAKAQELARRGAPTTVGSKRGVTTWDIRGGSQNRPEEIDARLADGQDYINERESVREVVSDAFGDEDNQAALAKAAGDYSAAQEAGDESLIIETLRALGKVLAGIIESVNEKLMQRGIEPMYDRQQMLDVRSGDNLEALKLADNPLSLYRRRAPWERDGWKVYKGTKDEPLSDEEIMELEAVTAQLWARSREVVEGRMVIPVDRAAEDDKQRVTVDGVEYALRTKRADLDVSWQDRVTKGVPATDQQRSEALAVHLEDVAASAASRLQSVEEVIAKREDLTEKIGKLQSRIDSDPDKYGTDKNRDRLRRMTAQRGDLPEYSDDDVAVAKAFSDGYAALNDDIRRMVSEAAEIEDDDERARAFQGMRDRMESGLASVGRDAEEVARGTSNRAGDAADRIRRDDLDRFQRVDAQITDYTRPDDQRVSPSGTAMQAGDFDLSSQFPQSSLPGAPRSRGVTRASDIDVGARSAYQRMLRAGQALNPENQMMFNQREEQEIAQATARGVAAGKSEDLARREAESVVRSRRMQKLKDQIEDGADALVQSDIGRATDLLRILQRRRMDVEMQRSDPDLPADQKQAVSDEYYALDAIIWPLERRLYAGTDSDGRTVRAITRQFGSTSEVIDSLLQYRTELRGARFRLRNEQRKSTRNEEEINRLESIVDDYGSRVSALENMLGATAGEVMERPTRDRAPEAGAVRKGMLYELQQYGQPIYDSLVADGVSESEARRIVIRMFSDYIAKTVDEEGLLVPRSMKPAAQRRASSPNSMVGQRGLLDLVQPSVGKGNAPAADSSAAAMPTINYLIDVVAQELRSQQINNRPASIRRARGIVLREIRDRVASGDITITDSGSYERIPLPTANAILLAVMDRVSDIKRGR